MSAPVALQPPGPGWGGGGGGAEDDVQLGGGAGTDPQHQQQRRTPPPAPRHFLVPAPDCCSRVYLPIIYSEPRLSRPGSWPPTYICHLFIIEMLNCYELTPASQAWEAA